MRSGEAHRISIYLRKHGPEAKLAKAIALLPHGYNKKLLIEAISMLIPEAFEDGHTANELSKKLMRICEPRMRAESRGPMVDTMALVGNKKGPEEAKEHAALVEARPNIPPLRRVETKTVEKKSPRGDDLVF